MVPPRRSKHVSVSVCVFNWALDMKNKDLEVPKMIQSQEPKSYKFFHDNLFITLAGFQL